MGTLDNPLQLWTHEGHGRDNTPMALCHLPTELAMLTVPNKWVMGFGYGSGEQNPTPHTGNRQQAQCIEAEATEPQLLKSYYVYGKVLTMLSRPSVIN